MDVKNEGLLLLAHLYKLHLMYSHYQCSFWDVLLTFIGKETTCIINTDQIRQCCCKEIYCSVLYIRQLCNAFPFYLCFLAIVLETSRILEIFCILQYLHISYPYTAISSH